MSLAGKWNLHMFVKKSKQDSDNKNKELVHFQD